MSPSVLFFIITAFLSKEMTYLSFFTQGMIFLSYYSTPIISGIEMVDNLNFMMICFTLVLGGLIFMICPPKQTLWVAVTFSIILVFFSTDSFMVFFVCYEFSLVPLMVILIVWGAQAERIEACQFMLLYTIIFSSPLLMAVCYSISSFNSMSLANSMIEPNMSYLMSLFVLAFLVKAPILILHSWLPKAHVESPIEGSMILAGIMLKFGIYGVLRMISVLPIPKMMKTWIFYFCLIGSLISCFLAISSDDMKMSVAYSSISHMNFLLSAIFSEKLIIIKGSILTMISHGISSPLLFILVTKIYFLSHSRSILISKGMGSKIPFLAIIAFIIWSFNFSAPPSLSFISEISIISSIYSFSLFLFVSLILISSYMICISFFSVMNYGLIFHSPYKSLPKGDLIAYSPNSILLFGGSTLIVILFFFSESLWM